MSAEQPIVRVHGNAYNLFILLLTVFSLVVMALLVLPLDPQTHQLLYFYDNAVCVVFLLDFAYNITGSRPKRAYFIHQRGWLDLLGSIPAFGFFQLSALLRLARLSRLARITRLLRGNARRSSSATWSRTAASTRRSSRFCRGRRPLRVEHPHPPVRGPLARRQHRDRRRRAVVGVRHDHHRRLR